MLLQSYKLRWKNAWDKERTCKEVGLIWMIWHKVVAVDVWRGVIFAKWIKVSRFA